MGNGSIRDIGKKAKELDKLSAKERTKLTKKQKYKLFFAFIIYCVIMVLLSLIL